MMLRRSVFALVCAAATAAAGSAGAWGSTGHRLVSSLAVQSLPPDLPAFIRSPQAAAQIGELGREPDRSRGAGQPHDADLDPGHFVDVDDQGRILGGPALADLPASREAYAAVLQAAGADINKAGYLPYTIEDGWEQLVKDFAYWRADTVGERTGATPQQRAWFAADRRLREEITIRDLGYWSHFVADGSQPMHVSIHYNGWGAGPNPNNYTQEKIHGPFEGAYVHDNIGAGAVRAAMRPTSVCAGPIQACVSAYLATTQTFVGPVYGLWGTGGFHPGDPRGRAFATERVAAGASELRDLVIKAWQASENATVGYPATPVRDVEAGRAPALFDLLYGND